MANLKDAKQHLQEMRIMVSDLAMKAGRLDADLQGELFGLFDKLGEVWIELDEIHMDAFEEAERRKAERRTIGADDEGAVGVFLDELCELMATTEADGA